MRQLSAMVVIFAVGATVVAGVERPASADPLLENAAPLSWRSRLLPESGPELDVPAYYGALDRAQAYLDTGQYRRAMYEASTADDVDATRQALIVAEAQMSLGEYDAALATLAKAKDARAALLTARIAFERGDFGAAATQLDELRADNPQMLQAHLWRGRVAEAAGEMEKAIEQYQWFVDQRFLQEWASDPDARQFAMAEDVVTIATALDRFATLTGEYRKDPSLHGTILNMFVRAYDVIDRTYWPARLAAARFLYERSDAAAASEELEVVLAENPNDAEALALFGRLALDQYDFAKAAAVAMRLRGTNPNSHRADELDAANLMLQRQPDKAEPFARRLATNRPQDPTALGALAAVHAMRLEEKAMREVLAEVEQIDPDNASAYFIVGKQLALLRQYPRAEAMLRKAVERAPWWTQPRNELGLLLTQSGDEAGARQELAEARAIDPFNAQTLNYLGLLEELATYDEIETEHFVIQYDREQDPLAAELFAEYLDGMQEDVARIYGWAPPEKTRIQIFPTHDRFSVRVAGDPFVGTVGACTGPVIAMVTPRDAGETLGNYDWAQVVRHEFTHTITLGRTDNRIPHWMTEGLAVREEQAPVRQEWLDLLSEAVNNDELFPVEELTWGFVRPRKPTDRSLAYAQSWFVIRYIIERWGEPAIAEMLDGFRTGKREAAVFREVLEIELAEFDQGFEEWTRKHVREWGRLPEQKNAYVSAAREGEQAIQNRDLATAVEAFERAHELRPLDELPMRRLAGLYLARETYDEAKALEMLLALHARTTDDNRFAKRAARLYLDRNEPQKARELAYDAVQIAPYDRLAHELLLEMARATEDAELVETQERRLAVLVDMED